MNSYFTVIQHELAQARASRRFWLLILTATLLIFLAVMQGSLLYQRQTSERLKLEQSAQAEWVSQEAKRPHVAHHFGKWVVKPLSPLSIFDRGVEDYLGQQIVLDAHNSSDPVGSNAEEDPLLAQIGAFDLAFVTAFLLPLMVIFLTYDAVCGEKERGTLRMVLSHPISRKSFLLGKWSANSLIIFIAFGIPLSAGILMMPMVFSVDFHADDLLRLFALLGASLAYLLFFAFCAMWVSSITPRPATALGYLFVLWVTAVFFLPKMSVFIAEQVHPLPDPVLLHREQAQIREARQEWRNVRFNEVVQELRKKFPEIPEDFAFSAATQSERAPAEWQVDPTGVMATESNAQLNELRRKAIDKVKRQYERQERLAMRAALISPTTSFLNVSMALAGTDPARHQHFKGQVDAFFDELGSFFNDLWARNVQSFNDWEAVPRFQYQEEPSTAVWSRFIGWFFILTIFCVVAAVGSILQLNRYDVR
ncbi:MAG: ABC transporter permease subunit [Candidatus Manganitrophus sp.]|nr:ABC transporter permease subunit [Candidatus Manganitrophus sp.]